jgi:hypothetical protein
MWRRSDRPNMQGVSMAQSTRSLTERREPLTGLKDWSWVTHSLSMISPRSLIVPHSTRPMGTTTACGIWRAAAGGRGSCQPCRTSACIIFLSVGARCLALWWFPQTSMAFGLVRRSASGRTVLGKVTPDDSHSAARGQRG